MADPRHIFGFLTRHDESGFAQDFHELTAENEENPLRQQVIEYLQQGKLCVGWMGFASDMDEHDETSDEEYDAAEFMGYTAVYTDGKWFWPEYVIGYLKKYPTYYIDQAFLEHLQKHNFTFPALSQERQAMLEKEFLEMLEADT